jgi:predicted methyltransferase
MESNGARYKPSSPMVFVIIPALNTEVVVYVHRPVEGLRIFETVVELGFVAIAAVRAVIALVVAVVVSVPTMIFEFFDQAL